MHVIFKLEFGSGVIGRIGSRTRRKPARLWRCGGCEVGGEEDEEEEEEEGESGDPAFRTRPGLSSGDGTRTSASTAKKREPKNRKWRRRGLETARLEPRSGSSYPSGPSSPIYTATFALTYRLTRSTLRRLTPGELQFGSKSQNPHRRRRSAWDFY